ncbi:MAG: polyprenyl synthetase family protein [Bacteroidales bacterium]|nr:polyprenyl synthetase family protein [Bacteroidales bacterium]
MITEALIDTTVKKMFAGIEFPAEPAGLYDPLRYMIEIGGKRIRPRLCLTAYSIFRDSIANEVLEPARALEVFHTFTLLHDDIMDRSPLRRGKPTVWKKWDEDTAILSGDVMQIDAYKRIATAPSDKLEAVLELFSKTAAEVCEGQQYDMEFERVPQVSMEEYCKMIGLKTAVLLACSAKMGALLAGASEKDSEAMYRYGYELGMAFQVADDYLDAFGDEKVFGKPIGGDILNCKKSWLTVRTIEKLSGKEREDFIARFNCSTSSPEADRVKIETIRQDYMNCGADTDARAEIALYTSKALEATSSLKLSAIRSETLRRFAEKLVGRAK